MTLHRGHAIAITREFDAPRALVYRSAEFSPDDLMSRSGIEGGRTRVVRYNSILTRLNAGTSETSIRNASAGEGMATRRGEHKLPRTVRDLIHVAKAAASIRTEGDRRR